MKLLGFFPNSVNDYRILQNFFETSKLEIFGLTLKSERPRKIILKGISNLLDEVRNEFINLGYSVHSVGQLKNI